MLGSRCRGEELQLSGAVLGDQLAFLRETYGPETVRLAARELSEQEADALENLTATAWCPAALAMRFKDAVARQLGRPSLDLQREVVRAGVGRTVQGVWRFIIRHFASDAALAKRLPTLYSKTFDRGEVTVSYFSAGRAELVLQDCPDIADYDLHGLAFGMETVLELAERCRPRAQWRRLERQVVMDVVWGS